VRAALVGLVVVASAVSLSACRTIGDDATASASTAEPRPVPPTQVQQPEQPSPADPTATNPDGAAVAPTTPEPTAPATTPSVATTSPDGASAEHATSPGASPDATTPDVAGADATQTAEAPASTTPARVKPADPWKLVGHAYVVDANSPSTATSGTTEFDLVFRTRGEFRGVRQGTPVTDDRHYKVGTIVLPTLPGYVPLGAGSLRRTLPNGHYCWRARLAVKGGGGATAFPLRRNGDELTVVFDLRGGTEQTVTVPVVVRQAGAGKQPVESKLGC
jgi:hypothetical protein